MYWQTQKYDLLSVWTLGGVTFLIKVLKLSKIKLKTFTNTTNKQKMSDSCNGFYSVKTVILPRPEPLQISCREYPKLITFFNKLFHSKKRGNIVQSKYNQTLPISLCYTTYGWLENISIVDFISWKPILLNLFFAKDVILMLIIHVCVVLFVFVVDGCVAPR